MKVGFTGTRFGMTERQKAVVSSILAPISFIELHHGDCVGADADCHDIVAQLRSHITIHPPVDEKHRAFKIGHETREPKTHFARNRDIVIETDILIATPFNPFEESRGGTWYTIDYARKKKRWNVVVWPDGSYTESFAIREV